MARNNPTLLDVALHAGVSKTTAASILRDAPNFQVSRGTRERVLNAATTLGYQRNELAAALSSGRVHAVGVLLPLQMPQAPESTARIYGQDVFMAIFRAASRAGLRVTPVPTTSDRPLTLRDVTDRRVDGLIMASVRDPEFVRSVYASGMPCVEIGSGHGARMVHPDNEGGAAQAVAHLVGLGHRRIVCWFGDVTPDSLSRHYASGRRLDGFRQATAEQGLSGEEARVPMTRASLLEALSGPEGERPTGVFAFNDYQATCVMDIARELGLRVPEDLSVVGFDNNILAEAARPALTTVHNPLDEQANSAIEVLQSLWAGSDPAPTSRVIPTRLVIRHSTAPPRRP